MPAPREEAGPARRARGSMIRPDRAYRRRPADRAERRLLPLGAGCRLGTQEPAARPRRRPPPRRHGRAPPPAPLPAPKAAAALAKEPGPFLSTVQIGITLIGILSGVVSGAALGDR